MSLTVAQEQFEQVFGRPAEAAARAPGRINLIGEHTDYNDGFVLPMAIERYTTAIFARRDDGIVRIRSLDAEGQVQFKLADPIQPGEPPWGNYCRGVAAGLIAHRCQLVGADILLSSDVPIGAGLSSSAALEVATAFALLGAADAAGTVPDRELALLCQRAENEFASAPCGIMDQSIAIMAEPGHALLLDCRDGTAEQIPFGDPGVTILVADTQVKHAIAAGEYGLRRQQCCAAADKLGLAALRDADPAAAEADVLSAQEKQRLRHVVGEIARTLGAAEALRHGDCKQFGRLMYASHVSLRDDFEVSCDELDAIVEAARAADGVFGARMTGGGFGGCVIILTESNKAEAITEAVQASFAARFNRRCPVFATNAAGGAKVIESV